MLLFAFVDVVEHLTHPLHPLLQTLVDELLCFAEALERRLSLWWRRRLRLYLREARVRGGERALRERLNQPEQVLARDHGAHYCTAPDNV